MSKDRRPASSIARHLIECGHRVESNTAFSLLYRNSKGKLLRFIEALAIKKFDPTLCVQKQFILTLQLPWQLEYVIIDFIELQTSQSILNFDPMIFTHCTFIFNTTRLHGIRVCEMYSMDASCRLRLLIVLFKMIKGYNCYMATYLNQSMKI